MMAYMANTTYYWLVLELTLPYILYSGILKNDEYELKLALPYLLYGYLFKNDEYVLLILRWHTWTISYSLSLK